MQNAKQKQNEKEKEKQNENEDSPSLLERGLGGEAPSPLRGTPPLKGVEFFVPGHIERRCLRKYHDRREPDPYGDTAAGKRQNKRINQGSSNPPSTDGTSQLGVTGLCGAIGPCYFYGR
jgi:hypothetical protein